MSRAKGKIKVILHPPTNEKDIAAIQEAFGELYAHIIEKVCEQLAG